MEDHLEVPQLLIITLVYPMVHQVLMHHYPQTLGMAREHLHLVPKTYMKSVLHHPMVNEAEAEDRVGKFSYLCSPVVVLTSCRFEVVSSPNNALALSNCIILHPNSGFREGDHVLVKNDFPLTVK